MGFLHLPATKRLYRQWRLVDVMTAALFSFVFLFFLLVFTSLGDSLAASGRRALSRSSQDHRLREQFIAYFDGEDDTINLRKIGSSAAVELPEIAACSAEEADRMPCEDPRRNSQMSRYMNYYRERHCPLPGESPLCLVPPPHGYREPVPWPESFHQVLFLEFCLSSFLIQKYYQRF